MKKDELALLYRAVINQLAGNKEKAREQYEEFLKTYHLFVPIRELLEYKRRTG